MPGRNDPCPCGSGKKYKKCCWRKDQEARSARIVPDIGDDWSLDLVPLPIHFDDETAANPAILLLTSEESVLHSDLVRRVPGEMDEVVALLAGALRQVMADTGRTPRTLRVLYPELAEALRAALRGTGIAVEQARLLAELEEVAEAMYRELGGDRALPRLTSPGTWAGWGLPEEMVAELFRAFAAFHRAAPWTILGEQQVVFARSRDERDWCLAVVDMLGEANALCAYRDRRDLWENLGPPGPLPPLHVTRDVVLTLSHREPEVMPAAGLEETRRAGWELAAPDLHPVLIVQGTPGGGIQRAHARDLIDMLWSLPRFAERYAEELADGRPRAEPLTWTDPETGLALRCWNSMLPEGELLAPPPRVLEPALAMGPNAKPEMALPSDAEDEQHDRDREAALDGFDAWLGAQDLPGLDMDEALATAESYALHFLAGAQGVPLCAQTELDLRSYIYEWFPLKVMEEEEAYALRTPGDLALFFRYLEEERGLRCPWAAEVLEDEAAFARRWRSCPGHHWWDDGIALWRLQLMDHLGARVLVSSLPIAAEDAGGLGVGTMEDQLDDELQRRWLLWRDEAIAAAGQEGEDAASPEHIRAACEARQRAWEESPHAAFEGRTPAEVVRAERAETRAMRDEGR